MKILNLCQCTNLGGMEQASRRLMLAMMPLGHRFKVLSLNPLGGLKPLLDRDGIPAEGLPYAGRGGWRSGFAVRRKLRQEQADALLMTGHHLLTMLALGRRWRGHRVLAIHFHHRGVKPDWQWRLIYRIACGHFEAIVFPSEFIRAEAEEIYPALRERSHVIRYPLNLPEPRTDEQRRQARASLGLPPAGPLIGNAGWLIERKRWDVFLEVAALVRDQRPDTRFVIAGDGPLRPTLLQKAERLGLADKITWLGWCERMDAFYLSIDVLLFNSDWDALPVTPQEAMSYAVPVVASVERGGLKEIIERPEEGFVLATHDARILADQVLARLDDPSSAEKVGASGRRRIGELSDPGRIADAYESLFRAGH